MKNFLSLSLIVALVALVGCSTDMSSGLDESNPLLSKDATTSTYYVYMSPIGNDGSNGSISSPLKTLKGVQTRLQSIQPLSGVVVKIRSDQGIYRRQTVEWTYYNTEYNLSFEPYPDSLYACFMGDGADTIFFNFLAANSEETNLHFRKLSIRGYSPGAIWLSGSRPFRYAFNSNNSVTDCIFQDIGNLNYPEKKMCYGVVDLVNSRNNTIEYCTFLNCANANLQPFPVQATSEMSEAGVEALPIIAVYLAHSSNDNVIAHCEFRRIKGDAVRFRESSNRNLVYNNYSQQTGWNAVYSMWFCHPLYTTCVTEIDECPSWENRVYNNVAEGNWLCEKARIFKDMQTHFPFGTSCPYNPNWQRARVYDNISRKCEPSNSDDRTNKEFEKQDRM